MTIVDDLLANPGLYLGVDTVAGSDLRGAARLVITPLPGGVGVAFDYEILNGLHPDNVRGHVEHTIVAKVHGGGTVMAIADTHAGALTILRETEPGTFEPGPEGSAYPMKVVLSVPAPGRLRHAWWYGAPGGEATERDVSELVRSPT